MSKIEKLSAEAEEPQIKPKAKPKSKTKEQKTAPREPESSSETKPEPELWEMTEEEYIKWCIAEKIIDPSSQNYEEELAAAKENYLDTVRNQIKENPDSVPERVKKGYSLPTEKPESEGKPKLPNINLKKLFADTRRIVDKEKNSQDKVLARLIKDGAVTSEEANNQKNRWQNLDETLGLLGSRLSSGEINRDKYETEVRRLLLDLSLPKKFQQAKTEKSPEKEEIKKPKDKKEDAIREALAKDDLYLKSIAVLLGESRKGKQYSKKGTLMKQLNLKSAEADEMLNRLASEGLLERHGASVILKAKDMADFLERKLAELQAKSEELASAEKPPTPSAATEIPSESEESPEPEIPEPSTPLTTVETINPEELPPKSGIAPTRPLENTSEFSAQENINSYGSKTIKKIDNLLERSKSFASQTFNLKIETEETDRLFSEINSNASLVIRKLHEISLLLEKTGQHFDQGEITHEEYLSEYQKNINQLRGEVDPIIEKIEQNLKLIEKQIEVATQEKHTPLEPGLAAAEAATEAEIEKSKNPSGARRWMGIVRKYWLRLALVALMGGAGEIGYITYNSSRNQDEKEKIADTETPSQGESSTPAESTLAGAPAETTGAAEETEPTEEEVRESLEDEVARQRGIISELENSLQQQRSQIDSLKGKGENDSLRAADKTSSEETTGANAKEINEAAIAQELAKSGQKPSETSESRTGSSEEAPSASLETQAKTKSETEGLTTERSEKLNKILRKTGLNVSEWERVKNTNIAKFLKKYGGLDGLIAIGDIYADTYFAMHCHNLAELIRKANPLQPMEEEMTLEEFLRYRESLGNKQ